MRIADHPSLFKYAGQALFSVGGFLVVAGVIGRAALAALGVARARAKLPPAESLSAIYPTLPTWWVPESLIGFLFALAVAIAGAWLALTAKRVATGRRLRGGP